MTLKSRGSVVFSQRLRYFARLHADTEEVMVGTDWVRVAPGLDAFNLVGKDVVGYIRGGEVVRIWEQRTFW